MKTWQIGLGAAAVVVGLGAIGVSTVTRGSAHPSPTSAAPVPKPLPLLEKHTAPIANMAKLKAAAQQTPNDPQAWAKLGTASLNALDYEGAADSYKKAVALDPAKPETWSALGEAYVHSIKSSDSKMPTAARAAFDKALALDSKDIRARFYIALERDYNGEHDAAVAEWLSLLRSVPSGSAPDEAIRAAILASVNRNIRLVSRAVEQTRQLQPKL